MRIFDIHEENPNCEPNIKEFIRIMAITIPLFIILDIIINYKEFLEYFSQYL